MILTKSMRGTLLFFFEKEKTFLICLLEQALCVSLRTDMEWCLKMILTKSMRGTSIYDKMLIAGCIKNGWAL